MNTNRRSFFSRVVAMAATATTASNAGASERRVRLFRRRTKRRFCRPPQEQTNYCIATDSELRSVSGGTPGAMFDTSDLPEYQAKSVCDNDQRLRIDLSSPTPRTGRSHVATCSLRRLWPDGSRTDATGFFVAPRLVLTAGHCVYNPTRGGWASRVEVIPAANGITSGRVNTPFGSQTVLQIDLRATDRWINQGNAEFDIGAVRLPNRILFNGINAGRTRSPVFTFLQRDRWGDVSVEIPQYPADKPALTQWWINTANGTCRIPHPRNNPRTLTHTLDTAGGSSGSPIMVGGGDSAFVTLVYGIHTRGGCPASTNSGVYLSPGRGRWILDNWDPDR
ncbi:MAG TPA: hypothetical protein DDW52_24155 [Planctomycetaceae bacterium]|nr:hypothetical protein [Planctomycetaceae bacterium]